jgi:hypothetical protein
MFTGLFSLLAFLLLLSSLSACAPTIKAQAPADFAAYQKEGQVYRTLNANGVVLRVKIIEEKAGAKLNFWKEAIHTRMSANDYIFRDSSTTTMNGQEAKVLEYATPLGAEDYAYLVAVAVDGDRVILAEAGGELSDYTKARSALLKALPSVKVED